nr:MAG TPA: hypothetical protein [Caudoviricetes sp.]
MTRVAKDWLGTARQSDGKAKQPILFRTGELV